MLNREVSNLTILASLNGLGIDRKILGTQSALTSPTVGTDGVWAVLKRLCFTYTHFIPYKMNPGLRGEGKLLVTTEEPKYLRCPLSHLNSILGERELLRSFLASLFLLSSFLPFPHPGIIPDLGSAAGKSDDPELWSYSHVGR